MLDVVAMLGNGWKVDDSEIVTSANQESLSSDLPEVCELRTLATSIPSSFGGQPSFAPPAGWTVYWVSRDAGYGAEALKLQDIIWMSPEGVAY